MPARSAIVWLLAVALQLVALVDGGSIMLTELSVPDGTEVSGQAAVAAVEGLPATKHNAVIAYTAAQAAGDELTLHIHTEGFRLYPDGRVTLTASRTAPTLVFHRLPWFRDLTLVSFSSTVEGLPFA
jgi:hypothetical protein